MSWTNRPVRVTGGASFIGAHLVDVPTDDVWRRGDTAQLAAISTAHAIGQIARDNSKPWPGRLRPNSSGL